MSDVTGASARPGRWLTALCAVAAVQIAFGLAGLVAAAAGAEWCRRSAVLDWQRAVVTLALAVFALQLLRGARSDERVAYLGALFLLIARFYAIPPIEALGPVLPEPWRFLPRLVAALALGALLPTLIWLFFRSFPQALEGPRSARAVRVYVGATVAVAVLLIAANLAIGLQPELGVVRATCDGSPVRGPLAAFDRHDPTSLFWVIVFGLVLPVLPFVAWRVRRAPADERARVRIFATGMSVAAVPPLSIAILPALSPAAREFVLSDFGRSVLIPINLLAILSMAAITSYAVVVQHVLDVRTLLRQTAQYWLARVLVGSLVVVPLVLLGRLLYEARAEPLGEVFSGPRLLPVLGLLALAGVVLVTRSRAMLAIDRLFFRESHDAREIFAAAADRMRSADSTSELAKSLSDAVDRALHPERVGLVVQAPGQDDYVPLVGTLRRLPVRSALVHDMAHRPEPMTVDLARPSPAVRSLPAEDRTWLADAGAQLVVPLQGSGRELPGLLVLGPKRSELPYSRDDLVLLQALAGAAGTGLESRILRSSLGLRPLPAASEEPARECRDCGLILETGSDACPECRGDLGPCLLPFRPFGKFALERRVGRGAVGVVYRAIDVTLDRAVALKTLPETTPDDSMRLRREARAMAAITHPNLALILGAESWRGTPILVIEYLAGGMLAERIARAPLGIERALDLAIVMAHVLERAHGAGILHRDVKPSNIGYTDDGVPKLLDFGLARIAGDRAVSATPGRDPEATGLAGTPLYMSPEALAGGRAEPGFDLWSLAVVVFEAAGGIHPFERGTTGDTYRAIPRGFDDAVAERLPDDRPAVRKLFESALAPSRSRRPATASELAQELELAAESLR